MRVCQDFLVEVGAVERARRTWPFQYVIIPCVISIHANPAPLPVAVI